MTDWEVCQKALGLFFDNKSLLEQAFVHSSYINENLDSTLPNNERLEFLGDAILDFVIAETLCKEFPALPEGELTTLRAFLVCRDTLAKVASSLNLGDWLLLGQGEEVSGGRERQSNLANTMEAVIGAIYLDQGLAETRNFILRQLGPALEKIRVGGVALNYKALVQEFVQGEKKLTPTYHLVETTGPDHDKEFTVEVLVADEVLGRGIGKSKKTAEVDAAKSAWEKLRCGHG